MDLHVLLRQLAVGRLQAASALGHRRLLTVVQLLQSGVPVGEEPHGFSNPDHTNVHTITLKAEGSPTCSSGCSSAALGPTSADLVQTLRFSTPTKPERETGPELPNIPQQLREAADSLEKSGGSSRWSCHLGEEASVAVGARLKSEEQTLV